VRNAGKEPFHVVLVSLERDQKTAVVVSGGATDPFFLFDDFPFSCSSFDAQVAGRKNIKEHFFVGDGHNLGDGGAVELENAATDGLDIRELFWNGVVLQAMFEEEPILQIASLRFDRFKFVSGQVIG